MASFEASLTEEFNSFVKPEEAQMNSFFKGKTKEDTGVVGETVHFKRRVHNEAIIGKPRHAPVENQAQRYEDVECKPKLIYHRETIDKYDMLRRTVNYKQSTVADIEAALWRAYDVRVRDVVETQIGSLSQVTGAALDDAGWQSANLAFAGYTDKKREMYAMIRVGGQKDSIADPNIKNNYWLNNKVMAEGELPPVYGFKPTCWNNLAIPSAGQRRNLFWIKDCVGVAIAEGVKIEVTYDEDLIAYKVLGTLFMDACIIDPTGVRYMNIADA
jgi:hypothetical protein